MKILKTIIITTFLGSLVPFFALAQSPAPCPSDSTFGCFEVGLPGSAELAAGKSIDSFVGGQDTKPILKFIGVAVNVVIAALVIIGVISIVIGGYMYMTAGGDGAQVTAAKNWIQSALVGIFISLTSVVVLNTINRYLGSDAAEPTLGETGAGTGGAGGGAGGGGSGTGGGTGNTTGNESGGLPNSNPAAPPTLAQLVDEKLDIIAKLDGLNAEWKTPGLSAQRKNDIQTTIQLFHTKLDSVNAQILDAQKKSGGG